ncbi:DUF2797 domain-containing protein [Natranaeroarchaeum sulfidigenes]|uniref:Putative GIY-YIG superfamily nuclease with N-terminal metal-binding region, DUF2797 family n=1 Tax=Natranaeroarchaeum sulfidigenes TaxID=2784880 RepID=A0A897MRJ6_9EURY|nr:DUF2797 domain-containing protein [Natranaeroarchaeum sulfidigenes]QSG03052.1 putative GIY-YIG superfamily nuclease with N-terminal metal-binding region, DUF2797 family [Natranaeroarchaeum sulfidigenes]
MQVVGYEAASEPRASGALFLAADGEIERRELSSGTALDFRLGDRHCAGTIDADEHSRCNAPTAPYCDAHDRTWICARCTGTCLKDEMDCYEEHAVYLAAFAPSTFKVGVTRSWRLETRLYEQGADRGAHLHTVSNGRIARELEAEIAEQLTDRVRVPTKIAGLEQDIDVAAWHGILDQYEPISTMNLDHGLELERQPVRETVASGTVLGVKGRIAVVENGNTPYAVDLRELVGYELHRAKSDRRLQSSFAAFE